MRIELPSGAWLDIREEWKGADRKKTRKAVKLSVTEAGVREMDGDIDDAMRDAMLAEIITGWSLTDQGIPIPSKNIGGADVIAEVLGHKDYNALQSLGQIQPLLGSDGPVVLDEGSYDKNLGVVIQGRSPDDFVV